MMTSFRTWQQHRFPAQFGLDQTTTHKSAVSDKLLFTTNRNGSNSAEN